MTENSFSFSTRFALLGSEEKRREGAGGWFTGRLCQEVALAFTVISASAMLCFL